jgi:hypothetical protein
MNRETTHRYTLPSSNGRPIVLLNQPFFQPSAQFSMAGFLMKMLEA